MLGYTHEELLQLNVRDVVAAEDQPGAARHFDELRAGKTVLSERRLRCKDGALLTVEISAKLLPNGALQEIVRDVAEREQALKLQRLSI
jgi:PAS domain S-box-containing protein